MWEIRRIERRLRAALEEQFDRSQGERLYALYVTARDKVTTQVLPNVAGAEPFLTDHSDRHIADVLDRVEKLLGEDAVGPGNLLTAAELYVLCLSVVFHDVGNAISRKDHERRIAQIYGWARTGERPPAQERHMVLQVAGAHAGTTNTGSRDTIHEVPPTSDLDGEPVRLPELAAILRLADECAEGQQRTSEFMRAFGLYDDASRVYHEYARAASVHIDRGGGRIALTLSINLQRDGAGPDAAIAKLRELLTFAYGRIVKLDEERQYARYYSRALEPFRKTVVQINCYVDDEPVELDLAPVELSDKRVPGGSLTTIAGRPGYDVASVCEKLHALLQEPAHD